MKTRFNAEPEPGGRKPQRHGGHKEDGLVRDFECYGFARTFPRPNRLRIFFVSFVPSWLNSLVPACCILLFAVVVLSAGTAQAANPPPGANYASHWHQRRGGGAVQLRYLRPTKHPRAF
jgi:hypothetical protein